MMVFPGIVGSIAATQSPGIILDGLIVYLDAQNTASYSGSGLIWNDLTTYNNTGTLNNGTLFETTEYNQKIFSFDGSNDYIELPSNFFSQDSGTPFSLSVWFKSNGGAGTILGQQSGTPVGTAPTGYVPAIYIDNTGKVKTSCFWGGAVSPGQTTNILNDNKWHNISYTYESGSRKTYVDGILDNTVSLGQASYSANYYYFLGAGMSTGWPGRVSDYFSGSISYFLFYNRKLTDIEILQNYKALNHRYVEFLSCIETGSMSFTSPDLVDSFEFQQNWEDSFDITSVITGSSTFTSPTLTDGFETTDGWS